MNWSSIPTDGSTQERLQSYITNKVPEDFRLDYKAADALPNSKMTEDTKTKKREEIGRDVTAFASSDGGIIIYGITEVPQNGRAEPGKFDPVSTSEMSAETLIQIITFHSEPTLVGVRIFRVDVPGLNDKSKVCFVVSVPKSDTAHMAKDGRYYYRNENTRAMMRDWQVRDAMNRRKAPNVVAEVDIASRIDTGRKYQELIIEIQNRGEVVAKHFKVEITLPVFLENYSVVCTNQTPGFSFVRLPDGDCFRWIISNRQDTPLFPDSSIRMTHPIALEPPDKFKSDPRGGDSETAA